MLNGAIPAPCAGEIEYFAVFIANGTAIGAAIAAGLSDCVAFVTFFKGAMGYKITADHFL